MTRNSKNPQQTPVNKVLAIHDLSGHSHTSLMVVIPIMNRMGISLTALPTAILSSNTEYDGFELVDMSKYLDVFLRHWKRLKLSFTCIYSGFLCSEQQVQIVIKAIELFRKPSTLVVVDPVMADNGKLYPCFKQSIVSSMRSLVSRAELITPNLTEAAFLLGEPIQNEMSYKQVQNWCKRLSAFGPLKVLITNVKIQNDSTRTSVVAYDKTQDKFHRSICKYFPINYPGTGDTFTSVLTSLLLNGTDFFPAINVTVRFVCRAIELTMHSGTQTNEGICLEKALKLLPTKQR